MFGLHDFEGLLHLKINLKYHLGPFQCKRFYFPVRKQYRVPNAFLLYSFPRTFLNDGLTHQVGNCVEIALQEDVHVPQGGGSGRHLQVWVL